MWKILSFIYLFLVEIVLLTYGDSPDERIPHLVTYQIYGDFEPGLIEPDSITLNGISVNGKTSFLHGKYILEISKEGYKTINSSLIIPDENKLYIIKANLETIPRRVLFSIYDFPDPIDPDVIKFNGKEYRDEELKPGKYELLIQNPGFVDIRESILITPDVVPYEINKCLSPKPVIVRQKITFDIPPSDELGHNYKVTLTPLNNPDAQKEIQDGEKVARNRYKLKITKEGYYEHEQEIGIFPQETPYIIETKLIAKPVQILLEVAHDVPQSPGHPPYQVNLIADDYSLYITNTKQIRPGRYLLDIRQTGYKFNKKEIYIPPSANPFKIKERLTATYDNKSSLEYRGLSLNVEHQNVVYIPYEVLVNGKRFSEADTFKPGIEVDMVFKFKTFETKYEKVKILRGIDWQIVTVPLVPLVKYGFCFFKELFGIELDGIQYKSQFFSDNQIIDSHLIQIEPFATRRTCYISVMVRKESKIFRVLCGYLYKEVPFSKHYSISGLNAINISKLLEHMEEVKKRRGLRESLIVLQRISNTQKEKIKAITPVELAELISYVEQGNYTCLEDQHIQQEVLGNLKEIEKAKNK